MIIARPPSPKPQIKSMSERHHEIKRRLVAGERPRDIASSMGVSRSWLSLVMSSPVFEIEMLKERNMADENAADIGKRLTRLAPHAMEVLERAIKSKRDQTNLSTMQHAKLAQDILDRVGFSGANNKAAVVPIKIEIVQFNGPVQAAPAATATVIENGAD